MLALESVRNYIELNGNMIKYRNSNTSLAIIDNSNNFVKVFKTIIQKIRKLFYINKTNFDYYSLQETKLFK